MNKLAAPKGRSNPVRQLIRRGLAAALPRSLFLTAGPRRSGQVCLTFDDGPDPEHTPRLLDALAKQKVRATFFVIGERAERFPQIVRRIVDEGHALGNHTWSHRVASQLSMREFSTEVEKAGQLLADIAGAPVSLYRPPLGKITARQLFELWRRRHTVVLWNSDPKDYQCRSCDEVQRRLSSCAMQAGDLMLFHDNLPFAAEVLPSLAAQAVSAGLDFTTVLEWARKTPAVPRPTTQPTRP